MPILNTNNQDIKTISDCFDAVRDYYTIEQLKAFNTRMMVIFMGSPEICEMELEQRVKFADMFERHSSFLERVAFLERNKEE